MAITINARSQQITEVIYSLKKSYNGFFSGKKSAMLIELQKVYNNLIPQLKAFPAGDTLVRVFIKVSNEAYEVEGMTSGISLFGAGGILGFSGSASTVEKLVKQKGAAYLDRENFMKLYYGLNSTYGYIKTRSYSPNGKITVLAAYQDEVLKFGGEYVPGLLEPSHTFYIEFDGATFKMQDKEFSEFIGFLNTIKEYFKEPKT